MTTSRIYLTGEKELFITPLALVPDRNIRVSEITPVARTGGGFGTKYPPPRSAL